LLHNLVNDLKLNQTVSYIILFLDLIYFFFKIDPNCTMNTPTPNFIKKLSWSSIYPLILRAVIIKGKKGPKGVGFLMQIWNGWECDQICLPWHARDRLINHLPLMWFFVHRIQIIWLWPKSHIIFCLFNPNIFIFFLPNSCHSFCESLQQQKKYYYVTMNSLFQIIKR
jgi:hypothetical protein